MATTEMYDKHLFFSQAAQDDLYKYIIDQYDWAEQYAFYYTYMVYAVRKSIIPILESIKDEDKNDFSEIKAYQYLRDYEKTRLNMCIIIPTYKRPEAIEFLLARSASIYRRYGIDIIIYDSSEEEYSSKNAVEEMRKDGFFNVIYKKYDGEYDGFSLDHKLLNAYKEYDKEYEYIWMCRDGLVPIIDDFIDEMREYSKKKIDCIIVDTMPRNNFVEKRRSYSSIEDCERLLSDQALRLQTLGMLIISNRLAEKMINDEPISEKNYSLWQMAAPLHLFAKEPYTILFLVKNVFMLNEYASKQHFWSNAANTLRQWSKNWVNVIMSMPKEYDSVKEKCLPVYTVDFHPFTRRAVIEMRGWGGLTYGMVKEHDKYISQVTKTPVSFFYFVSLMPRWLMRLYCKERDRHPRLFSRFC